MTVVTHLGFPLGGLGRGVGEPAPDLMRPPQAADEQGRRGVRRAGHFLLCHSGCVEAQPWPRDRSWQGTGHTALDQLTDLATITHR